MFKVPRNLLWILTALFVVAKTFGKDTKYKLLWPALQEPNYIACGATLYAIANYVNQRPDILPNYLLVPDYPMFINYSYNERARYYMDLELPNDTFIAPIAAGQDGGCDDNAASLQGVPMIEISQSCSGPYANSRRKGLLRNLYSTLGPTDMYKYAALETVQKIGRWRQVSIIFTLLLRDTVMSAFNLYDLLIKNTIAVKQFIGVPNMASATSFDFLALTETRIIIVMPSGSFDCAQFLCQAFRNGIKPPLYAFIEWIPACLTLALDKTLVRPVGCPQEVIDTQIAATMFIGYPTIPFSLPSNSSLGISPGQLDEMIREPLKPFPKNKVFDYSVRYACYDSFMASALVLNETEGILNSRYNLSLRDHRSESKRGLVYQVLNSAAAAMNYTGFRNTRIVRGKNGEINQDLFIMQPFEGKPRLVAHLTYDPIFALNEESGYVVISDAIPVWATKTGLAPKDLTTIEQRLRNCGEGLLISVPTIAGIMSAFQLALFIGSVSIRSEIFFGKWEKALVYASCLLLNASAVVHVTGSNLSPQFECHIRPILLTVGVTLLHSLLFAHLLVYSKFIHYRKSLTPIAKARYVNGFGRWISWVRIPKPDPSVIGQTQVFSLPEITNRSITRRTYRSTTILTSNIHKNSLQIVKVHLIVSQLGFVLLFVWFVTDPLSVMYEKYPVGFDEVADTYFQDTIAYCYSKTMTYWVGALLAFNTAVILTTNFLSITLREIRVPEEIALSSKLMRVAAVNAATILGAVILILVIMAQSKMPCVVNAVLAFGELIYSASMGIILLLPIGIEKAVYPEYRT